MMISNDKSEKYSTLLLKYPSYRDELIYGTWRWLEGRQVDDNAEGLWRVHENLYDLRGFIKYHPGGEDWLTLTKGLDITEAFESYHVSNAASKLLPKYFVRVASKPRNYKFTYEKDGFFTTLKQRAAKKLETFDKSCLWKSKFIFDANLIALILSTICSLRVENVYIRFIMYILSVQCHAWHHGIVHNFIHQRDNWRMHLAYITLVSWRDWRVFHALSHHLYPNSYVDYEITAFHSFFNWLPVEKSRIRILFSWFISPYVYAMTFFGSIPRRWSGYKYAKFQPFQWEELVAMLVPFLMFVSGNSSCSWENIFKILTQWILTLMAASLIHNIVAINAGHHGITITHEGDEFGSLDFGTYQLSATIDRIEIGKNLFLTLTHFGDHILHHLFPSLDHSLLPHLRGVLMETCEEFKEKHREYTVFNAIIDQFRQLARTETIKLSND